MRRRDFITLVGSAAVWPAAAIAQQNNKKQLVGFITGFNDKEMMPIFAAFRARMQELGWIEGQNIVFDVRTTSGDYEKLDTEAGSLVSASADLIVAQGTPGLAAARKYTKTIPIVFTQVSDPVGQRSTAWLTLVAISQAWPILNSHPGASGSSCYRSSIPRFRM